MVVGNRPKHYSQGMQPVGQPCQAVSIPIFYVRQLLLPFNNTSSAVILIHFFKEFNNS